MKNQFFLIVPVLLLAIGLVCLTKPSYCQNTESNLTKALKTPKKTTGFVYQNEVKGQSFDQGVFKLTNLTLLNASGNDFKDKSLPSGIGNLKKLKYLDLAKNRFTTLSKEIGELKNLLYLYLTSNQFTNFLKTW